MIRLLRTFARVAVLVVAVLSALVAGSMILSPDCDDLMPAEGTYDFAVVLSGGFVPNSLDPGSLDRTRAAVGLYERGVVEEILMTGDALPGPWSAAANMRQIAGRQGVPLSHMIIEPESGSTLQNAMFSRRLIPPDASVLLVTEGYHLWRGWASFAWAGDAPDGICQSSPTVEGFSVGGIGSVLREVAAWGYNLYRAPTWSLAEALGLEDRLPPDFLR